MADSSQDPVQRPPGPPSAPAAGRAHTGEQPPQHRCQQVPTQWSRFHPAGQQQQPSQPCCIIDQQWRRRHQQQHQQLFGVGHSGWVVSKSSRGRPYFPRRHFSSSTHRESTPPAASDLPQPRDVQNGSTLNTVADPMSADMLSGFCQQRSGWPHTTAHLQPDGAASQAPPGTRHRRRSRTGTASVNLAESDWKVPHDHGR